MIEWWQLYLIFRLNHILVASLLISLVTGLLLLITLIKYCEDGDLKDLLEDDPSSRFAMKTIPIFVISVLILCFVPSTKEAIILYGVPKVLNNEEIQDIGENSLKLLDEYIDKELEELKNKE